MRPKISVIISTHNRPDLLKDALISLVRQTMPSNSYEIIVADSYSTEEGTHNADVVNSIRREFPSYNISYFYQPVRGGWTLTRTEAICRACANNIIIGDDDFVADSTYVEAGLAWLERDDIGMVEGRMLPKYDFPPPKWIENLWAVSNDGRFLTDFTLLDFGNRPLDISPEFAMGSNFGFRKDVFYKAGGFGPDGFGGDLVKYNGTGELFLAERVRDLGLRIVYVPEMSALHQVKSYRCTPDYFLARSFYYGIVQSFADVRRRQAPLKSYERILKSILSLLRSAKRFAIGDTFAARRILAFKNGYAFHSRSVQSDHLLLEYCLLPNWLAFDFKSLTPDKKQGKSLW